VEIALRQAEDKIKSQERDAIELETALQRLSSSADGSKADYIKLQAENSKLEIRVRELQANIDQLASTPVTPAPSRSRLPRPRSSSLSNIRVSTLEQQLEELQNASTRKDGELRATQEKLGRAERDLTRLQNERMALEKAFQTREAALEGAIEEKNEELEYLRTQAVPEAQAREQELLDRIEEDEAQLAALQHMVEKMETDAKRNARMDSGKTEEQLKKLQTKLQAQTLKTNDLEAQCEELLRHKHTSSDQIKNANTELSRLQAVLEERTASVESLNRYASKHTMCSLLNPRAGHLQMLRRRSGVKCLIQVVLWTEISPCEGAVLLMGYWRLTCLGTHITQPLSLLSGPRPQIRQLE
jgi:predicted  nucleic acid-binding Zn-ribbon protein